MTQEDKQLLLKDLCARLPYGVICKLSAKGANISITEKLETGGLGHFIFGTMDVRPYLRQMDSMTEKERDEAAQFEINNLGPIGFNWNLLVSNSSKLMNWLNVHHFDYRGLIEKGLALEAPEGMYKTE